MSDDEDTPNTNPFDFAFFERYSIPLKRVSAGKPIFLEEDEGDAMYVVLEGRVNIQTFGTVLENIGLHGTFGEMALIDNSPRSAAAVALEATEVAVIDRAAFLRLVKENPDFSLYVMGKLASRIRRMNKNL